MRGQQSHGSCCSHMVTSAMPWLGIQGSVRAAAAAGGIKLDCEEPGQVRTCSLRSEAAAVDCCEGGAAKAVP